MPVAAAAVARAVPLGGLPEPTDRESKQMIDAMINGDRKTSADTEFRRNVKDNLLYRARCDNKFTVPERTQRASDGCS
eukprot:15630332-Heterocapsa_arctica.AAC.1